METREMRGSLTSEQIRLVREGFLELAPYTDAVAAMFYRRLFELDPALRPMFRGDLEEQGRKLMAVLQIAVRSLDRLESLLPAVRALGRRHADYGVQPRHYDTVAAALLWTLEKVLGPHFTPAARASWTACYTTLAATMQAAAEPQAA
jgi:hemoglobin-like flavoprotein